MKEFGTEKETDKNGQNLARKTDRMKTRALGA